MIYFFLYEGNPRNYILGNNVVNAHLPGVLALGIS